MRLIFTPHAWDDCTHCQSTDRNMLRRINRLLDDALRDPSTGIGKPEPLRHVLAGWWSRRISEEHRLVYLVDGDDLVILHARYHDEYVSTPTRPAQPGTGLEPRLVGVGRGWARFT